MGCGRKEEARPVGVAHQGLPSARVSRSARRTSTEHRPCASRAVRVAGPWERGAGLVRVRSPSEDSSSPHPLLRGCVGPSGVGDTRIGFGKLGRYLPSGTSGGALFRKRGGQSQHLGPDRGLFLNPQGAAGQGPREEITGPWAAVVGVQGGQELCFGAWVPGSSAVRRHSRDTVYDSRFSKRSEGSQVQK